MGAGAPHPGPVRAGHNRCLVRRRCISWGTEPGSRRSATGAYTPVTGRPFGSRQYALTTSKSACTPLPDGPVRTQPVTS
jgi:hypothetical protein